MFSRLTHPRTVFVLFFGLGCIESFSIAVWILQIPADPKNALFGGYSLLRLMMIGLIFLLSILFVFLTIYVWRSEKFEQVHIKLGRNSRAAFITCIASIAFTLTCLFLLLSPPPSLFAAGSAMHARVSPLLLLSVLIGFQGVTALYILSYQGIKYETQIAIGRIGNRISRPRTGYVLLALSLVPAVSLLFFNGDFGDEGDNITVGWLLSQGWVLYEDIFSHHFPFPYVWIALIMKVFGASIFPVRLSFILLRFLVFVIAMKLTRYHFALGLTALVWSILGHFYLGNTLIYYSFSGIFLLGAFSIGFAIINQEIKPRTLEFLVFGILLSLAILADPLAIYPAIICILFLFLSRWAKPAISGRRSGVFAEVGFVAGSVILCILLFFMVSITMVNLNNFYTDAILFNQQIYTKYLPTFPSRNFIHSSRTILGLIRPHWYNNTDPYYAIEEGGEINGWIFAGFLFRLSTLLGCILLFVRGRLLSGFFMYFFAAALLVRPSVYFYTSPFVLFSIFVASLLLSDLFTNKTFITYSEEFQAKHARIRMIGNSFYHVAWIVLFVMFAWLNARGIGYLLLNKDRLSYESNYGDLQVEANYYKDMTCNQPAARILVYPLDPIIYFLSGIPPASEYHFMTPWVAEIGQSQVIADLKQKPSFVLLSSKGDIWGHPVQEFLADLIGYLEDNYLKVGKKYYISPGLNGICKHELEE